MVQVNGSYIYIPVSDLTRAGAWYAEHLGFKLVFKDELYHEYRTKSGVRILLLPRIDNITSQMNFPYGTQPAYGFTVSDIQSIYQKFIDDGIEVGKLYNYGGLSFGFHDPDGNFIELWGDHHQPLLWICSNSVAGDTGRAKISGCCVGRSSRSDHSHHERRP